MSSLLSYSSDMKPKRLTDYLLEDMSSCSSNGFRSFPRRQCLTAVRFLLEIDLSKNKRLRSKSASSLLHRASTALINIVKRFPFPSVRSRKRSDGKAIQRLISFRVLVDEKPEPLDYSKTSNFTNCEVNTRCNDVVLVSEKVDGITEATTTATTNNFVENTKKTWLKEDEKEEQFSPVSVLEFPFHDEEVSSPFHCNLIHMEGTKQKPAQNIRRFEGLTQLEPVDLEKRIASSESIPSGIEQNAVKLLKQMKTSATIPLSLEADNLLLDFFREKNALFDYEVLDVAKDWINGHPRELLLDWDVPNNREAYIVDMDKGGLWEKLDEEKQEVALELEAEFFTTLVNEMWIDLIQPWMNK